MTRETALNIVILAGFAGFALYAYLSGAPFLVTLATKAVILGMAGVGLNLALGYGGLVSFGHAAFFGIGGYAAGILASAAQNYEPLMMWPLELPGTTSMPVICCNWKGRLVPVPGRKRMTALSSCSPPAPVMRASSRSC